MISREAAPSMEARLLPKSGPMGSAWQGRVWFTLNPSQWCLLDLPELAGVRQWGRFLAFGDDELLREMDLALAAPASLF